VLYAGAAGVSQVALLASVAFWTWLWGPLGLLMATPLTVCLVVLGKHVPGLEFVGMLMADTPALAPEHGYYQRLLARDQAEAADLIERHIKTEPHRSVYDALLLPALNYAERDRLEQAFRFLEEPQTRQVNFGQPQAAPPRGNVYLNPQMGVLLIAANLPPLTAAQTYEMWLIPKGPNPVPRPAGLFQSASSGATVHTLSGPFDLANIAAVAVTVEPAAGSPAPTSTPILAVPIA